MSNQFSITATALDVNNTRVSVTHLSEVFGEWLDVKYDTKEEALESAEELADQADTSRFPGIKFAVEEGAK